MLRPLFSMLSRISAMAFYLAFGQAHVALAQNAHFGTSNPVHAELTGQELFLPPTSEPVLVLVDFYVVSVPDIDLTSQQFTTITSMVVQWNDPRLAFDESVMGRDSIEFTDQAAISVIGAICNPAVSITNRYLTTTPSAAEILLTIYQSGRGSYEI